MLAFTTKAGIIDGTGCIAQLVEQLTLNQWVQGSSPCASTRNKNRPMGGFFIKRTAIILDPSVPGTESPGNPTYSATNATWSVEFPYGIVSGVASCNSIEGTWATAYSGDQNNITTGYQTGQMNCWCRMLSPVRSAWVINNTFGLASDCASSCAYYCGSSVRSSGANFRRAVFGSAGN